MKVLFCGIGSIGQRHMRNLKKVIASRGDELEVHVFRQTDMIPPDDIKEIISRELRDIESADSDYDVAFITNITVKHMDTINKIRCRTKFLFVEKPVFDNYIAEWEIIERILPLKPKNVYVACPLRYTDVYKYIKNNIQPDSVLSARIICSSYMPDWQKGRDYRKSFRTKKIEGGGVDIDLIHEIDYMISLFGIPMDVKKISGKYSELEMDCCDLACYLFEYPDFIVEVHLDYFGMVEQRYVEIITKDEVIRGDFLNKNITYLKKDKQIQFDTYVDHYYREMEHFIDIILGVNDNNNNIIEANKTLKYAKGVK